MTVVLVDPRRPGLVPVDAIGLLTGEVAYTEEMPIAVVWALPAAHPAGSRPGAPVLLSSQRGHPAVTARLAAGQPLIAAPPAAAGERLLDAVAVMDRLRSAGPWEAQQTHDSLRRFLLEETYELFDAVRGGDAEELREELGDVLLQVLFHARIAEEAPVDGFGIDDVADALLRKLGNRVPAVLAGEAISLDDQLAQWEQRKALEKRAKRAGRGEPAVIGAAWNSVLDDVPTGQPALALAQQVLRRVTGAGFPPELVPVAMTTVTVAPDTDAENDLRCVVLDFMDDVRSAEQAIAANRHGSDRSGGIDDDGPDVRTAPAWLAAWPGQVPGPVPVPEDPRRTGD